MDQQAALRWVQNSIARVWRRPGQRHGRGPVVRWPVRARPHDLPRFRGLFHRAIVQSGTGPWALEQKSLAAAEADGEAFAAKAGCPDQTADCLRRLPVADLVNNFPGAAVPAVVDGEVLEEPIGTALAAGRFARVPILNGTNHDEERVFISAGVAVTGAVVPVPEVTAESYQRVIGSVLDVPAARAAAITAEYPLEAYPSPTVALSALVSDASFACPALQMDLLTSKYVPTFAYEFNDDSAPLRYDPPVTGPRVATHKSEWAYLFDLPDAPFQEPFSPAARHSRPACERPGRASRSAATRPPRTCPGLHSTRTACRCCRSCRHGRRSRRTSPPGTIARSGPPGNHTPRATPALRPPAWWLTTEGADHGQDNRGCHGDRAEGVRRAAGVRDSG